MRRPPRSEESMLPRRHTIVIALALAAPAALPAAAQASPRQPVAFEAPRELLDYDARDRTLDEIRDFGVTNIRQLVYWRDFAPRPKSKRKPRGRFDAADSTTYPANTWSRLDLLMQAAEARGTAVGRRYGDRVATWSIWNEPNQPQFLMPQYRKGKPYSPGLYRRLYQVGVKGLEKTASNRGDTFLLGETSPRGNSKVVFPLDFFRRMLCLDSSYKKTKKCGRLDADGYAHHAYTTAKGPRFVPHDARDVTLGVLSRLERALDRAGKAGALPRGLPVYLTEFGIQSRPVRIQGVTLPKQAAYLSIAEHMAYVNPRLRSFSQYLMSDDRPRASELNKYAGFESGLRTNRGRKKPAYKAFRLPLAVENYGATDVLWGLVRQYRQATTVRVEVDPKGKKGWRKLADVETTGTGVYSLRATHRKGQRYRVKWTAPDGKRYSGASVRAY